MEFDHTTTKEETYETLSEHERVLKRPAVFIGGVQTKTVDMWVAKANGEMVYRPVRYTPGLHRVIYEIISNIQDNATKSKADGVPCRLIEIEVTESSMCARNDGRWIPMERSNGVYQAERIFGVLGTSSNYDDDKDRIVSGLNGLGAKLTNIYSTEFHIRCVDPLRGEYTQTWRNNMYDREEPHITKKTSKSKNATGLTEVRWTPDFERFGKTKFSRDDLAIIRRMCYNCAVVTGIPVTYNGKTLTGCKLKDYAKLYAKESEQLLFTASDKHYPKIECVLIPSPNPAFDQVSFVNGMEMTKGGLHITTWSEALFRPLVDKIMKKLGITKKDKKRLTIGDVRKHFMMVMNIVVNRPQFDSQSKQEFEGYKERKGKHIVAVAEIPLPTALKSSQLMKWSFVDRITELHGQGELKKLSASKRKVVKVDDKVKDANLAGGSKSSECVLCVCEGDSASTFIIQSVGQSGRDKYGILPLKGKILNVAKAPPHQITKNAEIQSLITLLGAQTGVDYTDDSNFKKLRYGKLWIVADADKDGVHIQGLVMNVFYHLFPSLIRRGDFVYFMRTPILQIKHNKKIHDCYSESEYNYWVDKLRDKNYTVTYFKGLAALMDTGADIFASKMVRMTQVDGDDDAMELAFSDDKGMSDKRKTWLNEFVPPPRVTAPKESGEETLAYKQFIDSEFIEFSRYDNERSIPSVCDGLKPVQRKVIYTGLKKAYAKTPKVFLFASDTVRESDYHHGPKSVEDAIVTMGQSFPGSNNLPLVEAVGAFGTRRLGGKDSGATRYISGRISELARSVFVKHDMSVLKRNLSDELREIEPSVYAPILPLCLVNGANGIGTGYSTSIPLYNPADVCDWIETWIIGGSTRDLTPWYRGFTGTIQKVGKHKYETRGVLTRAGARWTVSELPVGVWNDTYVSRLKKLESDGKIKNLKDNCSDKRVLITFDSDEDMHKLAPVVSTLLTSNMVLWNTQNQLVKYDSVSDIMTEYCEYRLGVYEKRKDHMLQSLQEEIRVMTNKCVFIRLVIDGTIRLNNADEWNLLEEVLPIHLPGATEDELTALLNLPVRSLTRTRYDESNQMLKTMELRFAQLKNTDVRDLWRADLKEFKSVYERWESAWESAWGE